MKNLLIAALAALAALTACTSNADRTVIVKVNDTRITAGSLKRQIADLSPETLKLISTDEKARKSVLDDLIAFELVLQEARRRGMENFEFNKRQEQLRKEMERRLQEDARNELVGTLLRKELGDKLQVAPTEAEVRAFYEKYQDKMVTAGGRKVGYAEAAPEIRNRLVTTKQRDLYMEYANTLRAKAKVNVNEEGLKTLAASLAQAPDLSSALQQLLGPEGAKGVTEQKAPAAK